jgi:hypothetical protein
VRYFPLRHLAAFTTGTVAADWTESNPPAVNDDVEARSVVHEEKEYSALLCVRKDGTWTLEVSYAYEGGCTIVLSHGVFGTSKTHAPPIHPHDQPTLPSMHTLARDCCTYYHTHRGEERWQTTQNLNAQLATNGSSEDDLESTIPF